MYCQRPARYPATIPGANSLPPPACSDPLGCGPCFSLPVKAGLPHHHRFCDLAFVGVVAVGTSRRVTPAGSWLAVGQVCGSSSGTDQCRCSGGVLVLLGDHTWGGVHSACHDLYAGDLGPGSGGPSLAPGAAQGRSWRGERKLAPHGIGAGPAGPFLSCGRTSAGRYSFWPQALAAASRLSGHRPCRAGLGRCRDPSVASDAAQAPRPTVSQPVRT